MLLLFMQISSQLRWNVRRVAIALISIPRRVITLPASIATCIEQVAEAVVRWLRKLRQR